MEAIMWFTGCGKDVLKVHSNLGAMGWQLLDGQEDIPDRACGIYQKGSTKAALFVSYDDMVLRKLDSK